MAPYLSALTTSSHKIYESTYGPLDVPTNLSVPQFLVKYNPDDVPGDKTILSDFENGNSLTYSDIRTLAGRAATGLVNLFNVKEGDIVAVLGLNSVNWVLLAHSMMWAGGVFAGINAASTAFEVVKYLKLVKPKVVAVDGELVGKVERAFEMMEGEGMFGMEGSWNRPRVLVIEDGSRIKEPEEKKEDYLVFPKDILSFTTAPAPPLDLTFRDNRTVPACICFSSGTSGSPKAVLLSHHNLIAYPLSMRASVPLQTDSRQVEVFFPPFAHIFGICIAVMNPAYTGQHVVAMPRFDLMAYLRKCADVKATVARVVPSTAVRLVKDSAIAGLDLRSINTLFVSGASLSEDVAKGLEKRLAGISVLNGYGMSEGSISMLKESQAKRKPGSVGKPTAGVSIRVVDDAGKDVKSGESGECWFKGATVFMRYYGDEAATRETFREGGWLATGDVVTVDREGYFYITGRKKELIKVKGNQVPPAELEAVLLSHPLVNEAGVCGIWDSGIESEVPVGYVNFTKEILTGEREKVLSEIRGWVDERVAKYKRLKGGLHYLETMPKNNTGKLVRRELPAARKESRPAKL